MKPPEAKQWHLQPTHTHTELVNEEHAQKTAQDAEKKMEIKRNSKTHETGV